MKTALSNSKKFVAFEKSVYSHPSVSFSEENFSWNQSKKKYEVTGKGYPPVFKNRLLQIFQEEELSEEQRVFEAVKYIKQELEKYLNIIEKNVKSRKKYNHDDYVGYLNFELIKEIRKKEFSIFKLLKRLNNVNNKPFVWGYIGERVTGRKKFSSIKSNKYIFKSHATKKAYRKIPAKIKKVKKFLYTNEYIDDIKVKVNSNSYELESIILKSLTENERLALSYKLGYIPRKSIPFSSAKITNIMKTVREKIKKLILTEKWVEFFHYVA